MSVLKLVVFEGGEYKVRTSSAETVEFLSIKVGATGLEIKETAGHFDFSAKNLTNVGQVDGRDVSADGAALDSHLANTSNPHSTTKAQILAGNLIVNADVDNAAAIAESKLALDFSTSSLNTAIGTKANDADVVKKAGSTMNSAADLTFQGGGEVKGLPTVPTTANSAASKAYVDAVRVAARVAGNVRVASTANLALATMPAAVDGITLTSGDRFIAKNQTDPKENGIYVFNGSGSAATRSLDFDNSPEGEIYNGVLVPKVLAGSVNGGKPFIITSVGTGTGGLHSIGVDNITIEEFNTPITLSAGDGINSAQFASNIIQVQVSALVGDGIEDDGSNNFTVKLDGATLTKSAAGLKISVGGISANELAALSVSTAKLQDDAVTKEKVAADVAGFSLRQNTNGALEFDPSKSYTNDNASPITIRQVVYLKANGNVDLAQANIANIGDFKLAIVEDASIASAASGKVYSKTGVIISGFSGLTPSSKYYLSPSVAGGLTTVAPTGVNESVYLVGWAVSATELELAPRPMITIAS